MLKQIWNRWMVLAEKIGNFNTRLILTLFYMILVVPMGLVMRLFHDPLRLRRPSGSGWIKKDSDEDNELYARRQF